MEMLALFPGMEIIQWANEGYLNAFIFVAIFVWWLERDNGGY